MGIPWDGMGWVGIICCGMGWDGTEKYVQWTSLSITIIIIFGRVYLQVFLSLCCYFCLFPSGFGGLCRGIYVGCINEISKLCCKTIVIGYS